MSTAIQLPQPQVVPPPTARASVDVVIPVHNDQGVLPASLRRLHDYLSGQLAVSWRIVIADNASSDKTLQVALALAEDLPGVEVLALCDRGRALRAAWERSDADVLCYMDAGLSTDLRALPPLLEPLLSGHSEVAIGTRLAPGSRVVRGRKRELISRSYNGLLRAVLGARFSDAQCGFKAIRADAARLLLPAVRDEGWFFDTELLVLAQREGMRIHEVPVDWIEDPDSRVDIVRTALEDLRGIARLLAETRRTRFLAIGAAAALLYALLYLLLSVRLGAEGANALALTISAVANTEANRHLTFAGFGRPDLVRQYATGALTYIPALVLTTGSLVILHGLDPHAGHALELVVLLAASACPAVLRSFRFGRSARIVSPPAGGWPTSRRRAAG